MYQNLYILLFWELREPEADNSVSLPVMVPAPVFVTYVSSPDPGPVPASISCSDLVSLPGPDHVTSRPWSYPCLSSWSRSLTDLIPISVSIPYSYIEDE